MTVDNYYHYKDGVLNFKRDEASAFAKEVAGDFNPIHDPENRRFCVPGDLLFSVVIDLYSARSEMEFGFEQMVDDRIGLGVRQTETGLSLSDDSGKCYLTVSHSGFSVESDAANNALVDAYVKFSGKTFPFLLVDLMQQHNVMINPQRPLVIYRSMSLQLNDTTCESFDLAFSESSLQAFGKKGEVELKFDIVSGNKVVGKGQKNMLLGGLREYKQDVIDELVNEYNSIKSRYLAQQA